MAALEAYGDVPVVAVDVPSGVDVDTGETPEAHVTARLTVTFGTHKVAHLVDPAAAACGETRLVDIGLDLPDAAVTALDRADVARLSLASAPPSPANARLTPSPNRPRSGSFAISQSRAAREANTEPDPENTASLPEASKASRS